MGASNVCLQVAVGLLQAYLTCVETYNVIMHKMLRAANLEFDGNSDNCGQSSNSQLTGRDYAVFGFFFPML